MYRNLILHWSGYDNYVGGVERVVPSKCSEKLCPVGYTGFNCKQLKADKIAPIVEYCPGDLWVIAKNGSAIVNWNMPRFTDNVGVVQLYEKNGHKSGQTLLWGYYEIIYVAVDAAENKAICTFKVSVLRKFKKFQNFKYKKKII